MPVIEAVGTALPETRLDQDTLTGLASEVLPSGDPATGQMLEVIENTGIRERALARPLPWYLSAHGHRERAEAYQRVGLDLVEQAAGQALVEATRDPEEIDGIVLVSTTGLATPSLDARLINRMALDPGTLRVPVWGLGCAGGVAGLNRAADLARAHPDKVLLLVCLELCSLSFSLEKALEGGAGGLDKKTVIAATLFGDGCAGCLVAGDEVARDGLVHRAASSHQFPDTERLMGWEVTDDTLDVVLSPEIPALTREALPGVANPFLDEHLGPGGRPDHWVLHPGGTKVLEAYRKALGLDEAEIELSRRTLAEHGNMSSPTVLFALERAWRDGSLEAGQSALLAALGPGFAAELCLLEV